MGSPILGSSDIPTVGEIGCLRKWVNEKGPKIVPTKYSKGLRLHLTEY